MKNTKRLLSLLLSAALLFSYCPYAFASETAVVAEETYTPIGSLPESSLLYDEYLNQMFYPNTSVSFLGESAREQLSPMGQKLYDFLKINIQKVSSGEIASTVFTLKENQLSEWGATTAYSKTSTQTVEEAVSAAMSSLKAEMEVDSVIDALLHDCPYELYWYDKVSGVKQIAAFTPISSSICVSSLTFRFFVVEDMQTADYSAEAPEFDTSNVMSAAAASENALSIVSKYETQSDYQKLLNYKNEICSLVSYNHTAASKENFSVDADPWQLIYVFDGDLSTNVVCEGYSKAFQYLFDLSDFTGNVDCVTVAGDSSGEGHMWNIVSFGSVHYLTDITNSDADTAGADGGLFLAGASGSIQDGFQAKGLLYTYRDSTLNLWGSDANSRLNISTDSYPCASAHTEVPDPAVPATCDAAGLTAGSHCSICKQILTPQETVSALGHDMGDWENTKEPSCTEAGSRSRACLRSGCSHTENEIIPVTDHEYQTAVTRPTCTEAGYTTYTCACGHSYTADNEPALGHDLGSWKIVKDAGCIENGSKIRYCTRNGCSYSETGTIPAVGSHTFTNDKDPTCNVCEFTRTITVATIPVYRLYNPYTQEHLLTGGAEERDLLISIGWSLDGVAWEAPVEGIPVYRLYNPYDDWHTYTTSEFERDTMVAAGWTVDGVVSRGYDGSDGRPIYRLFNPYVQTNFHLFTAGIDERDMLVNAGWILEGVAWSAAK